MKKVNVYIYSDIRTIKKTDGAAGYVLSYMTKKDIEATLSNIVYLEDVTRHEAELEVLNQALSRLNTKDIVIGLLLIREYDKLQEDRERSISESVRMPCRS